MTKDKNRKKLPFLKSIILFILIVAIILSILFAFNNEAFSNINWEIFNPSGLFEDLLSEKNTSESVSIMLDNQNIKASGTYMGNLLLVSDSDIRILNGKGEELWYLTHDIMQPVMQINGQWILIYDNNGKSYLVINKGRILIEDTLEENISFGDISDKYILFITWSSTGYKRTVHLISPEDATKLGALYIDDFYPFYSAISKQKDSFILNGLGMNSSKISTILRKYSDNLNSGLITDIQIDGLYPVILENPEQNLFVGENNAQCYSSNLEYLWSVEFDSNITASGIFDDGGSVFASHGSLCFYDSKGKELKRITVNDKINSIVAYKDMAAVISGSTASFYNSSGKYIDMISIPGLSVKVHFIDGKKMFVLSEHEAIVHNLKN